MQRKRRCAYDSETLEEYIEISSRDERYYNSKEPSDRKIIQGFEFVNYVDSQNLPPEILQLNREPSEQIFTYYIMMLGSITDQLKSALLSYCQESRKNSLEESDFVSPIKNKLCLDLAIKRILRTNGVHVVKFYIHDISIQTFEQIIKGKQKIIQTLIIFLFHQFISPKQVIISWSQMSNQNKNYQLSISNRERIILTLTLSNIPRTLLIVNQLVIDGILLKPQTKYYFSTNMKIIDQVIDI